jgi:hypothetical protein
MNFVFNSKATFHCAAQKIRDWMKKTMGLECKTVSSTEKNILYNIF